MKKRSTTFNIQLSNIPLVNLRHDFDNQYLEMRSMYFRQQFFGEIKWPIRSCNILWNSMPSGLLTIILQKAIVGVESWIAGAVCFRLGRDSKLSEEYLELIANPNLLNGRTLVNKVYDRLPALVNPSLAMSKTDRELFEKVKCFYGEVRNPIMHGYELDAHSFDGVVSCFDLLNEIYRWSDSWFSLESIFEQRNEIL